MMTTLISLNAGQSGLDGSRPDSNPLDSYRCNVTQPMLLAVVALCHSLQLAIPWSGVRGRGSVRRETCRNHLDRLDSKGQSSSPVWSSR